jgi:hypothetical protein
MAAIIVTIEDLTVFKQEIVNEIKSLLSDRNTANRKWLKTYEVRKILGLSQGSLQNLRLNGSLPYSRVGGIIYYDYDDIQKLLDDSKRANANSPFSLEKKSIQNSAKKV